MGHRPKQVEPSLPFRPLAVGRLRAEPQAVALGRRSYAVADVEEEALA